MNAKSSIPYRRDIDGLRALAVLPVLFFHADLGCSGGYVGVDVFFVISGYLIGSLVVAELRSGSFRMVEFWERRVRRIFPALAVVVLATLFFSMFVMVPRQLEELGRSVISQPFLVANFYFWRQSGYFEVASEFQPLLHTWSLAVEEQFYLFFPLVMLLLMRGGMALARLGVLVFLVLSLAWSIYGATHHPSASFFLIPSRVWELDLGVLLALLPPRRRSTPRLDHFLGWLGMVAILTAVFGFTVNTPFPGSAALLPCLGAALLIYSNTSTPNSTGRLLGLRPFVFIGKISYSLYLWHWPVIVLMKYTLITGVTEVHLGAALLASFFLACLSYRYVETPFRTRRWCGDRWRLFSVAGAVSVLLVLAGGVAAFTGGLPSRVPEDALRHAKEESPFAAVRAYPELSAEGTLPVFGESSGAATGKLLLWGDSHAMSLLPVFDRLGQSHGVAVHAAVQPEIAPIAGAYTPRRRHHTIDLGDRVLDYALEQGIDEVVLASRWTIYVYGTPDGNLRWLLSDEETYSRVPSEAEEVFARRLRSTVKKLQDRGAQVWIFREVGEQPLSVPEAVSQAASRNMDLNSFALPLAHHRKEKEPINALIDGALESLPVKFLDPLPVLGDESGLYPMAKDGRILYSDRHHLSSFGATQLEPILLPLFEDAVRRGGAHRE